jgi:hypothetical protein
MQKIRAFFNSMEERFVFPIGRRTYQTFALLALLLLGGAAFWLLINTTPTGKDDVVVSKSEVIQNQIDTTAAVSQEPTKSACSEESYKAWVDTLKADLPKEEWKNLGQYIDEVVPNEKYDYYSENNTEPEYITQKTFQANLDAVPNMLNNLYLNQGIDSTDYCQKIAIMESLHYLISKTSNDYKSTGYRNYLQVIQYNPGATKEDFVNSFELEAGIELKEVFIEDDKTLELYYDYFKFYMTEKPSQTRIDLAVNTLKNHYKVGQGNRKKDREDYFEVASIIIKSGLTDEELTSALDGYNSEMAFYSRNGLLATLHKYLKLYEEKLSMALAKQEAEKERKSQQRMYSLYGIAAAFAAIVSVAGILLLFSIQSILKRNIDKE